MSLSRRIPVRDGIEIHLEETGGGDPLVFVHPLLTNAAYWEGFKADFKDSHRVISYDCRGHGQSTRSADGYSIDDHIDDLAHILETVAHDPATIVGYSMGSYIGLGIAIRRPELVSAAVLVSCKSHGVKASASKVIDPGSIADGAEAMRAASAKVFASEPDPFHLGFLQYMASSMSQDDVAAALAGSGGFDFRNSLDRIRTPLLIVHGEEDALNPIGEAEYIAEHVPSAKLVRMSGCGHECPMEDSTTFRRHLSQFIGTGRK